MFSFKGADPQNVDDVSDLRLVGFVLRGYPIGWVDLQITAYKFPLLLLSLVSTPSNLIFKLYLLGLHFESTRMNG